MENEEGEEEEKEEEDEEIVNMFHHLVLPFTRTEWNKIIPHFSPHQNYCPRVIYSH